MGAASVVQSPFVLSGLIVALAGLAAALRILALGLGIRVPWRIAAVGAILPLVLLLPWLVQDRILASTDLLTAGYVPGTEALPEARRYEGLNDMIFQFAPWEIELRRLWSSGSSGFWSDALEGGSSPWVNPQASVLSPTAWIARAFPIQHFFLVKAALQLLVCFLGVAVFVRRLGASWVSAVLAGAAAALSGAMIPWAMFTHTAAVAWVPWTTTGLVVLARKPNAKRLAWTGIAVCLLLLSGHPEVAFSGGCLGVLVAVCLRSKKRSIWRLSWLVAAAALGFLLAAPAVMPFLNAVGDSQRAGEVGSWQEILEGADLGLRPNTWFANSGSLMLSSVLHPNAFGRPYLDPYRGSLNWPESGSGYAGLWALAGVGLCIGLGLRRSFALIGFAVIALLLAANFIPLLRVARALPVFDAMVFPRMVLVGSIALCAAAGLGFDAIRRRAPSVLAWLTIAILGLLSIWAGGRTNLELSLAAWALVAAMLYFGDPRSYGGPRASMTPRLGPVFGLLLIVVAQLPWSWRMLPSADPSSFFPSSSVFDGIAAVNENSSGLPHRMIGIGYHGYPSHLSTHGLHQTRSHNPMAPRGWLRVNRAAFGFEPDAGRYFAPVEFVSRHWLDALSIGAVLSETAREPTSAEPEARSEWDGLELAFATPQLRVYANPGALDRWFVAKTWEQVSDEDLESRLPDLPSPAHAFVSDGPPGTQPGTAGSLESGPRLLTLESKPGRVRLLVDRSAPEADASQFLLATSLAGPIGWSVDARDNTGRRMAAKRTQVHGAFLGAWIPPNADRVTLRYTPPFLRSGLVCMLVALVAVGFLLRPWAGGRA